MRYRSLSVPKSCHLPRETHGQIEVTCKSSEFFNTELPLMKQMFLKNEHIAIFFMKIVILVRVWKHFGWSKRKIFKKSYNFRISYFFILTHSTTATITIKNTALTSPSNHEKGLSTSPRFRYCHFVVYAVPLHYAQCVLSTACTDIPSTAPSGTPYCAFSLSSQNEKFKVQQLYIRVFTSWFIPIIYIR